MENALVDYQAEMAALAQQYAKETTVSGNFITISGGIMQLAGEPLLGNQVCAVILDAVRENTYYPDKYDPENPSPPRCYAFGRLEGDMAPHPSMQGSDWFQPQHEACKGCPKNEWGSAALGKGKACQNRRRLLLLPAGYYVAKPKSRDFDLHLHEDADHYRTADTVTLKLPVTSTRTYDKYVQSLAARRLPPCGVVTRVYCEPDPKSQYVIGFEPISSLPEEIVAAVWPRHQSAEASLIQGYSAPTDDDKIPF
jgi:hypothetical protein